MRNLIRWGILGTGKIASEFAQGLQLLPNAQLLAVGSRSRDTAEKFARQFKIPRAYPNYEALVQDGDIDVVYIATPHITHKENCLLCLEADKAVLCEKPFTLNAAEAQEVIGYARRKKLFCMEAMWMRFIPLMRKMQDLVHSQAIGDICMLNASLGFRVEFDPQHRAFNPLLGGGALLDLGVYPLSLAFQLLGTPSAIVCQAELGATGVDEQAAVILQYEQGQMATLATSLRTFMSNDATIMGTKGEIHIHEPLYRPQSMSLQKRQSIVSNGGIRTRLKHLEILRRPYQHLRPYLSIFPGKAGNTIHVPSIGNGYQYEAAEVMACLQKGSLESNVIPLDETLQIMATMDHIRGQLNLVYPQEQPQATK